MKVFKTVYPWEVEEKLNEGKDVFMVDRLTHTIYRVSQMNVGNYVELMKIREENKTRFDFWLEEDTETEVVKE